MQKEKEMLMKQNIVVLVYQSNVGVWAYQLTRLAVMNVVAMKWMKS